MLLLLLKIIIKIIITIMMIKLKIHCYYYYLPKLLLLLILLPFFSQSTYTLHKLVKSLPFYVTLPFNWIKLFASFYCFNELTNLINSNGKPLNILLLLLFIVLILLLLLLVLGLFYTIIRLFFEPCYTPPQPVVQPFIFVKSYHTSSFDFPFNRF